MLKKMGISLLAIIALTFIINIILALASKFLPISFVKPEALVEAPHIFHFTLGNFKFNVNQTVLNTWVIMLVIIIIIKIGTKNLSVLNPSRLQIVLEEYYQFIEKTFVASYGEDKGKFVPFFAALFAMLLFANTSIFIFPFVVMFLKNEGGTYTVHHFFRTPTADLNTTIGLALVVLILANGTAIKKEGLKHYLMGYFKPMWFMFPLNVIEKISNVLNTSMRLFGNMLAGLVIAGLLYSLVGQNLLGLMTKNFIDGPFSFSVGWPMALQLYLDLFVGVIQAFIFTTLSSVYVGEAFKEEEHEMEE